MVPRIRNPRPEPGIAPGTRPGTRNLAAQAKGLAATDPITFAAVSIGIAAACVIAGLVTINRCARIDPVEAVRCN